MGGFNNNRGGGRFGRREERGDRQMHEAVCAECGNPCKVPFAPMSGKPVYCSNCFEDRGNGRDRSERFERPQRPSYSAERRSFPAARDYGKAPSEADNQKLEAINAKLEKILKTLAYISSRQDQIAAGSDQTAYVEAEVAAVVSELSTKPKARKPRAKKAEVSAETEA